MYAIFFFFLFPVLRAWWWPPAYERVLLWSSHTRKSQGSKPTLTENSRSIIDFAIHTRLPTAHYLRTFIKPTQYHSPRELKIRPFTPEIIPLWNSPMDFSQCVQAVAYILQMWISQHYQENHCYIPMRLPDLSYVKKEQQHLPPPKKNNQTTKQSCRLTSC